jgi:hypothetical protein
MGFIEECGRNGLSLKERTAGQASDLYAWFSSPIVRRSIRAINRFWFRYVKAPGLACSNIPVFAKT